MPDLRPIDELRHRLANALALPLPLQVPKGWADDTRITQVRQGVEAAFNGLSAEPSQASIQTAVTHYARSGSIAGFAQLKHVCYGLALPPVAGQPLLIQSPRLFDNLLDEVDDRRREPRQYRRCYQALLQSYLVYDRPLDENDTRTEAQLDGDDSFDSLRVYLKDNLSIVARPVGRSPAAQWTLALVAHENLLTEAPCDRYVDELRQGQTGSLQEICAALGVSRQSWIWQEVVLAYLRELCAKGDREFIDQMPNALDIADQKTELRPSAAVARKVVATVTARYAKATPHPEQPRLRDMSVDHIGNPWLKRPAWDAYVADEPARKMVDGWLKGRLIRDFFELLSHDGRAEQRRLDYWLRFESVIDDMWFVLGASARRNPSQEFKELRLRMEGRRRHLDGTTTDDNNAFVMRIGDHVFVEFGVTGNACFIHNWRDINAELESDKLHIDAVLKNKTTPRQKKEERLTHSGRWESTFDAMICPLIGFRPNGEPRFPRSLTTPDYAEVKSAPTVARSTRMEPHHSEAEQRRWLSVVLSTAPEHGTKIEDHRAKGGALWVMSPTPITASLLGTALARSGFKFKPGKGYWLEDD